MGVINKHCRDSDNKNDLHNLFINEKDKYSTMRDLNSRLKDNKDQKGFY